MHIKTKIFLLFSIMCITVFSYKAYADYSDTQYHMELQDGGILNYVKFAITLTKQGITPELYNTIYNHVKELDTDYRNNLLKKCPDQDPLTLYIDQNNYVILQNCDSSDTITYPYSSPIDNINLNNIKIIGNTPTGTELIQNASNLVFDDGYLYVLSCKPGYHPATPQGSHNIYGDLYSHCFSDENFEDNNDDNKPDVNTHKTPDKHETTPDQTAFIDIDNILTDNKNIFGSSSVWKDDDGGFNTTRLISDSVAGVVLGTVGGVITSNIIKTNQIKNGFESLKCTIGGQDVARMGDEFNISVK